MATATEAPATTAEGLTQHTPNQAQRPSNTFGYTRAEQIEALRKLREPFPATEIRFLPRYWCQACKNSRNQGCNQHPRQKCRTCGQNLPGGHIDLRYVGHAEATNRLLNVDPFWDWEPLSVDERGLPQMDGYRGLWVRLTVCGMTRMGYGHAGEKTGGDAMKEIIGDAIRNAGMRFGMALDLWTSSDLEIAENGPGAAQAEGQSSAPERPEPATKADDQDGQSAAADTGSGHVDRLMGQVRRAWDNHLSLGQIEQDATEHQVIDKQVQGPDGAWVPFRTLLKVRIAELKQAAAERNAA